MNSDDIQFISTFFFKSQHNTEKKSKQIFDITAESCKLTLQLKVAIILNIFWSE